MTSCSNARENICAYIDNELSIDERLSFEEHIKNCDECKNELNEILQVVELCNDLPQQELPVDFKAELHEKLLAVAGRQDSKVRSLKKSKSFLFTKTFASIAAGMLLIFLAGSFLRFGLFTPMKSEDSSYNTAMAAEQPVADKMEEKSDAFGAGAQAENAGGAERAAKSFSAPAAVDEGGSEVDRSATVQDRETALAGVEQMLTVETANKKLSTITITADDPEVLSEKVKSLALENSGDIKDNLTYSTNDISVTFSEKIAPNQANDTVKTADSLFQAKLYFIIPDTQYNQFITDINTAFGEAYVQTGAFVTEDMTDIFNSYIARTNEIDNRIQELQEKDSVKNLKEIDNLKEEKNTVDSQIEEIRLGSDFVNVTVLINKK